MKLEFDKRRALSWGTNFLDEYQHFISIFLGFSALSAAVFAGFAYRIPREFISLLDAGFYFNFYSTITIYLIVALVGGVVVDAIIDLLIMKNIHKSDIADCINNNLVYKSKNKIFTIIVFLYNYTGFHIISNLIIVFTVSIILVILNYFKSSDFDESKIIDRSKDGLDVIKNVFKEAILSPSILKITIIISIMISYSIGDARYENITDTSLKIKLLNEDITASVVGRTGAGMIFIRKNLIKLEENEDYVVIPYEKEYFFIPHSAITHISIVKIGPI